MTKETFCCLWNGRSSLVWPECIFNIAEKRNELKRIHTHSGSNFRKDGHKKCINNFKVNTNGWIYIFLDNIFSNYAN